MSRDSCDVDATSENETPCGHPYIESATALSDIVKHGRHIEVNLGCGRSTISFKS